MMEEGEGGRKGREGGSEKNEGRNRGWCMGRKSRGQDGLSMSDPACRS